MATIPIEQAAFSRLGESPPQLLAKSSGFLAAWEALVQSTLLAFGTRPVGVACPSAVFARPLGKNQVMVVHAADLDQTDTATRPLGFHVIVVPRKAYTLLWHNPFVIAERLPPDWLARGELPAAAWPDTPLPVRTVEQVRQVLRRVRGKPLSEESLGEEQIETTEETSESPALLGGVQALVDGGKLVFHRPQPDTDLLQALWTLLPNSVRGELWPASFAFSNELQFDVIVVPRFRAADFSGYTTEELAADYPEGRYEYSVQLAAEAGDQSELSALFERRSLKQTWRLGVALLVMVTLVVVFSRMGLPPPPRTPEPPARVRLGALLVGQGDNPLNAASLVPLLNEETWKEIVSQQKKAP